MLTVHSLGKFQLADADVVMGEEEIRSAMLSKLLMYLLIYRDKTLTTEELTDALWQEENRNPKGALKNLVYRLRKKLSVFPGGWDFIRTDRDAYGWNRQIPVELDADCFESLVRKARMEASGEIYGQAVRMYEGDFMPGLTDLHWILSLNAYYHSLYLDAVREYADFLVKRGRIGDAELAYLQAIRIEPADEQLYAGLMKARMQGGKPELALMTYEKAREFLERELGIHKPPLLEKEYSILLSEGKEAASFQKITKELEECRQGEGFFCGYLVFREIFRLESRKCTRCCIREQLVLITLDCDAAQNVRDFRLNRAMKCMEELIRGMLRAGDVASKYSDFQMLLLLYGCSRKEAEKAVQKLIDGLYEKNPNNRKVRVKVNIEEICSRP